MRISDWSSDVCSSDLVMEGTGRFHSDAAEFEGFMSLRPSAAGRRIRVMTNDPVSAGPPAASAPREIGILAVPGFELLDLAGPLSLFASRSEEHPSELHSLLRTSYAVFCLKQKTHKL